MASSRTYDVVVLGGGTAAFAALTEADRRGLKTAIVNAGLPLGGTCVNVGCIPSKRLLAVAESAWGPVDSPFSSIEYGSNRPTVEWNRALSNTQSLIADIRSENYVDVIANFDADQFEGYGSFVDETTIEVIDGPDEGARLSGRTILVATGSAPRVPPIPGIESTPYETSDTILERETLPDRILVLGGGYVGLEWGQILHRFGVDVTILQRSAHVLSGMDPRLGRELEQVFRAEGIDVITDVDLQRIRSTRQHQAAEVVIESKVDGTDQEFNCELLFLASGVQPRTDDIGLEMAGVETDDEGAVIVDENFATTNPAVYAAGDVIGDPSLESVAGKEGNLAVENAFGEKSRSLAYQSVPRVIYTSPEVASIGITESEYRAVHGTCSSRTIHLSSVPKARTAGHDRGFIQVIRHHETDVIVGVHAVGPQAGETIAMASIVVTHELTPADVIDTILPFPTFSEALKRACQAFHRDPASLSCCVE